MFEESCELDSPDVSFFLPQPENKDAFVSLLMVCRTNTFEFPECVSGDNQGRFARTLHMSLIC